jgi:alkanesulfonate monooxygenase SsuD/methylene tetrahydromethanopterin reductase-like flavin-dependent oxidoreductase (luciferase family)
MRFGTYYFLQAPPSISHPDVIRHEIEQMVWTEELGFDSIWLTEHHFIDYGLSVSPAVLAAAAAMQTRRVRIGLAAAILPFHDPVRLAEELAIVDILSEGRLDVGVGRGNRPVEFDGYRVPQIENREPPGPLGRVAARLRRLGVGEMLCWMNFGGLSQDRVDGALRPRGHAAVPLTRRPV